MDSPAFTRSQVEPLGWPQLESQPSPDVRQRILRDTPRAPGGSEEPQATRAAALAPRTSASPRRIIVLRAGALGDTIVTIPALAAFRGGYPQARIALVGNARAAPLLRVAGLVDEAHSFDDRWIADLYGGEPPSEQLRARLAEVDLAIVWSRNAESPAAEALRQLGIPTLAVPSFPAPGVRRHLCDHLLETIAPLGLPPVEPLPRLAVADAERAFARDFWRANGLDGTVVVAVHVGSGSARKNWPAERFAAVADRLAARGSRILLVAGPADTTPTEAFRRATGADVVAADAPRLGQLAALLARADAYLGNDSGVSHLAAAVGTPTVAIFGPTDPALWAPRGPNVIVLWRANRWQPLEPRSIDGGADEGSLEDISVEQALSAIESFLVRRP